MDLASRLGRLFHRTSQPAFYVRIVAALLVLERLRLMIPDIKKKFKHLAFTLVKKKHKCLYHVYKLVLMLA